MKERDNRDIQFTHLAMENVRLQNYARELEEELRLRMLRIRLKRPNCWHLRIGRLPNRLPL